MKNLNGKTRAACASVERIFERGKIKELTLILLYKRIKFILWYNIQATLSDNFNRKNVFFGVGWSIY